MICKELCRSGKVQERIKALNSKWNLSSTPNDTRGIQRSIKEWLEIRLQTLVKNSSSNSAFKENHNIRVKLNFLRMVLVLANDYMSSMLPSLSLMKEL